jgi:hypothetical protein
VECKQQEEEEEEGGGSGSGSGSGSPVKTGVKGAKGAKGAKGRGIDGGLKDVRSKVEEGYFDNAMHKVLY